MTVNPTQTKARAAAVVVNDDLTQIEELSGLLTNEGLKVQSFSGATSALEAMTQAAPPSLIVTGLYMPGIDGWRFCRLLRSPDYATFNHVPIMAVSATFAGEEAARVTADLGANTFLPSPVDAREFTEQVRQLLRGEQPRRFLGVLIVDDDEALARMLHEVFTAHGYQADIALTGREAEAKFKTKAYDVVVIDHHLPDISGVQLLEDLQEQCAEVVYLAMTGDPRPEQALEWMKRGAAAFVRKPFAPQYLIELCAKARREQDLLWVEHRLELRTRELRQSEERFAAFMSHLPAAAFLKDAASRTLFANQYLRALPGFQMWCGKDTRELVTGELGRKMAEDDRRVLDHGPLTMEEVITDNQGVVHVFETIKFPIRIAGQPPLLGGIAVDITERKRAEEALRKSEANIQAIIANTDDIIASYDRDVRLLVYNRACSEIYRSAFGIELRPGLRTLDLFPESQRSFWITHNARALAGETFSIEFSLPTTSGQDRSFESFFNPIRTDHEVVGFSTFTKDITERKRAEEEKRKLQAQLAQAQKMESVGRLAGGVAHDFNNMLGAILGNTSLVLEDLPPDSPWRESIEEIEKCAHRSADLTRQLLAFARKQTVAPKVLDLNATLEGMLKMLRRLIGEDIGLAWAPASDLWPVKIDPSQIDQILANLCVNARDAISGVGKITLETGNATFDETFVAEHPGFAPGAYIRLSVRDNGCGMDKETQACIFEPFFTTKDVGRGTGLGLATVYGIVRQNQGFINVYSEPAHGTTFNIYLPRHADKAARIQALGPAQPAAQGHETILLVEDEPSLLRMIMRTLEKLGYTVLAASTPGEAIRLAEEHPGTIHLLLTDVVMPEMNGRELAKRLLSLYPELKRLFVSGYTADVIAHHGVLDEGVHFIQKPFTVKALADKLRKAIGSA